MSRYGRQRQVKVKSPWVSVKVDELDSAMKDMIAHRQAVKNGKSQPKSPYQRRRDRKDNTRGRKCR